MKSKSGKVMYRKFTANSGPESNSGNRAVIKMIIMIIILKAIIRYLNFNGNTPIITQWWNDKIKIILRQRHNENFFPGLRGIT